MECDGTNLDVDSSNLLDDINSHHESHPWKRKIKCHHQSEEPEIAGYDGQNQCTFFRFPDAVCAMVGIETMQTEFKTTLSTE